jgi:hypothetical protein
MIYFNQLDIKVAYHDISIDRDCCMHGMRQAEETFPEGSVEYARTYPYWSQRYKRMTSTITCIRALIEREYAVLCHLSNEQLELFHLTYHRHQRVMGKEMRTRYSRHNITKVVWDQEDDCLKVYYDNGDWLHYTRKFEWY